MFSSIHQALEYIGGCSRVERPRVVERETVKEDGTVVKRCVRETHVSDGGTATSFYNKKSFINTSLLLVTNS